MNKTSPPVAYGRRVALAGNPNVGKSTVFNQLTGLRQHTGNWPGKTVEVAHGHYEYNGQTYELTDLPGTYSLLAHSAEEEVARDHLCFERPDSVVVVCDATCLLRNMNLVLQTLEISSRTVVCVNLMDEAAKKHMTVDCRKLSENLGVPVVGTSARGNKGLTDLRRAIEEVCENPPRDLPPIRYTDTIEEAVARLMPLTSELAGVRLSPRWLALRLLENDRSQCERLFDFLDCSKEQRQQVNEAVRDTHSWLEAHGVAPERISDMLVSCLVLRGEEMCYDAVQGVEESCYRRDRRLDRLLTGKWTGIPLMLLLLCLLFWLTIEGANAPSEWLFAAFERLGGRLDALLIALRTPAWLHGLLLDGVFRVLSWVVAVMLPPMAIFFPLFTLLEDLGVLPRIAFNMDHYFQKACSCGKQSLTMCMGLGCNAVGVTGCRIIDSPRERLLAVLTNSLVPCNGRFPTIITLITLFFVGAGSGLTSSLTGALGLTAVILIGILATLLCSRLLSKTVLKGVPSSFALELPPYRLPQIGKVVVRSVFDRTLFVLGRAVAVAAPAGAIIWLLAGIHAGDLTLLQHLTGFLDPFGRLLGMDGVILMAFLLGFPANEIVIPLMIMGYMAEGTLRELGMTELHTLLLANGWTPVTAICVIVFALMHWPCSTTCLTIHKETGSLRWTAVAVLLPTLLGMAICFAIATVSRLFI